MKSVLNLSLRNNAIRLIVLYAVITVMLIIGGIIYYHSVKENITQNRYNYLKSVASFHYQQITKWLEDKYADCEILKREAPFINPLPGRIDSTSSPLKTWLESLKSYYGYNGIQLLDKNRKIIYSSVQKGEYETNKDSAFCNLAFTRKDIVFSDYDEKSSINPVIKFYIPLISRLYGRESVFGYLILIADPHRSFDYLLTQSYYNNTSLEALLIKSVNDSTIYLSSMKYPPEGDTSRYIMTDKALTEASGIDGRPGFMQGIDYKNDRVIAYLQKIPNSIWFLITKMNESEFDEPAAEQSRLVIISVAVADLFFLLLLLLIWRKNILSNYEKMYETEVDKLKSEKQFDTLVKGVKDYAIFILDENGNVMTWNEGAEKIHGYQADEIIGKHFSSFFTEEAVMNKKPVNELKQAEENGSFECEEIRIRKNGTGFLASIVMTPLRDHEGKLYGFLKVTRDLTESKKNEEEIKKSRDFYLKLLDDFPNPVWRSDVNGKCNYFNKSWLNFTGRKLEQETGDGWLENVHSEDRDRVQKEFQNSFASQKSFVIEYRLKDSHDQYKWVVNFGMPYYGYDGNFSGYLGSCYDIDARKKYEDTINTLLRISEKLYSSLEIDQISDSIITESIQLTNAESGFICLLDDNQFISKRIYYKDHWEYFDTVITGDDPLIKKLRDDLHSYYSNDAENDSIISKELVQKYFVKEFATTPLIGTSGELLGFFELHNKKNKNGFSREDVNLLQAVARNASISIAKSLNFEKLRLTESQLRNSESELRKLAAQIQSAREEERQRIAREVHDELGQLFTGINLNISLLLELIEENKKPDANEILEELRSVQVFVNKGIQTVRDISGSLRSYVLDHLGLIPAIQEYCREIERISGISCTINSEIETYSSDDDKIVALFRIVQEALTNIIRHAEADKVEINIWKESDHLNITISDNGKGISGNQDSLNNSMGILGMKERAIFLDGKLDIESRDGKGTKINLSVPMK